MPEFLHILPWILDPGEHFLAHEQHPAGRRWFSDTHSHRHDPLKNGQNVTSQIAPDAGAQGRILPEAQERARVPQALQNLTGNGIGRDFTSHLLTESTCRSGLHRSHVDPFFLFDMNYKRSPPKRKQTERIRTSQLFKYRTVVWMQIGVFTAVTSDVLAATHTVTHMVHSLLNGESGNSFFFHPDNFTYQNKSRASIWAAKRSLRTVRNGRFKHQTTRCNGDPVVVWLSQLDNARGEIVPLQEQFENATRDSSVASLYQALVQQNGSTKIPDMASSQFLAAYELSTGPSTSTAMVPIDAGTG